MERSRVLSGIPSLAPKGTPSRTEPSTVGCVDAAVVSGALLQSRTTTPTKIIDQTIPRVRIEFSFASNEACLLLCRGDDFAATTKRRERDAFESLRGHRRLGSGLRLNCERDY